MKSNYLIHEIIEKHGCTDNRELMKDLKALRMQVAIEAQRTKANAMAYLKLMYSR